MKKLKLKTTIFIMIILSLLATDFISAQFRGKGRKIIFDRNTAYYRLIVFDKNYYRYLVFGTKVYQTIMDKRYPDKLLFEYAKMIASTLYLDNNRKQALLLGLGGGAIVKYIQKYFPEMRLDIAEIDPMVIKISKKFFYTKIKNNIKAYAYDGRIFVKRINKKYDIIMLDAFNSDYIPFHLMTKEYLNQVKRKLSYNGMVLQNIWTNNALFKRIMNTFRSVFKYVYFARGKATSNAVIMASNKKINLSSYNIRNAYKKFKRHNIRYSFYFKDYLNRFKLYTKPVVSSLVLTDEHAPVNYYHRRKRR